MINNKPTYISLFSSAGIGCYGFKIEDFECIATNELIKRRIDIQKINKKCKLDTGYINADITKEETKNLIFNEIKKWKKMGNDKVDVLIATPPCQGMSIANHKKNTDDYNRNSLVVDSIKLIKEIKPRFFILENVSAFINTTCEAPDGTPKSIGTVIKEELGKNYCFIHRVINFKNYGANSSRTRTLVIGVSNKLAEYISPIELYPTYQKEKTLRDVIGDMSKLEWGEFDKNDFYHQFRTYDECMRNWIKDTLEGESAFDNVNPLNRPHRLIDGKIVPNVRKNGGKYTRNCWDKVAPCIHTRNDQLASQNTIHPEQDRAFSIRELEKFMTIPDSFRWINQSLEELNNLLKEEKKVTLKKEEMNIRQSIGEAVPTEIFRKIAHNIKVFLSKKNISDKEIEILVEDKKLSENGNILNFIKNDITYSIGTLSRIIELANAKREEYEAFFTNKTILNEIYNELPTINKDIIRIVEPSVGIGNFLPYIVKKYEDKKEVIIDVFDINEYMINALKELVKKYNFPENIKINYFINDTLIYEFKQKYDLCVGNPPFANIIGKQLITYQKVVYNNETKNIASFFMEKALSCSNYVVMITPKNFLNTPEYYKTRTLLNNKKIDCILDFGEKGFKGVLIETICYFIDNLGKKKSTKIISITKDEMTIQKQDYITDDKLPYWLIYRSEKFDKVFDSMDFDIFTVFRDRQITNSNITNEKEENIRVLKSRNMSDTGEFIVDIESYDAYITKNVVKVFSVYKYLNDDSVYLTPNMTYNPRMCRKPKEVVVNGSIAILILKKELELSIEDLVYFSSKEYREFYRVARNYQTRSLNVDNSSVFFFGKRR